MRRAADAFGPARAEGVWMRSSCLPGETAGTNQGQFGTNLFNYPRQTNTDSTSNVVEVKNLRVLSFQCCRVFTCSIRANLEHFLYLNQLEKDIRLIGNPVYKDGRKCHLILPFKKETSPVLMSGYDQVDVSCSS